MLPPHPENPKPHYSLTHRERTKVTRPRSLLPRDRATNFRLPMTLQIRSRGLGLATTDIVDVATIATHTPPRPGQNYLARGASSRRPSRQGGTEAATPSESM